MGGMISSTGNGQIKNIVQLVKKAKVRNEQGVFVVEGVKIFRETPKELVRKIYVSESFWGMGKWRECLKGYSGMVEVVADRVFGVISDTKTPQGILCIVSQLHYSIEEMVSKEGLNLLVLEDLQDPGNLGTIMRTAEGAGVDGVILSKNSVDIYNPKTIRSTMGSIYRVPFLYVDDTPDTLSFLKKRGVVTYAAHLDGKNFYDEEIYGEKTAFLIGNESNGLSVQLAEMADKLVRIPMEGELESLNAAIACAVLVYEVHRQKKRL